MGADFVQTITEFRTDRYGAPLATRSLLFWYPRRGLRLIAANGVITSDDLDLLITAMRDETVPGFTPIASLVDMSHVEHVDPAGFDRFVAFMKANVDEFRRVNLRSAYIHGSGNQLATAAVAGYSRMLGSPFPTATYGTVTEGLSALGFEEDAPNIAAHLEKLKRTIGERFQIMGALEAAIHRNLVQPSPERIAEELGRPPRTLQRELSALGTTLTDEVEESASPSRVIY